MRRRRFFTGLVLVAASLLGACQAVPNRPSMAQVTGQATIRGEALLPADVRLEVRLEDVSRLDAPARVIASARLPDAGQPPYRFTLPYPLEAIDASARYNVRASLSQGARLLFVTDTVQPVITAGHPSEVDLVMVAVPTTPGAQAGASPMVPGIPASRALPGPAPLPATFVGDLPCADCPAIAHHLDLFADQVFHLRQVWQGRSDGARDRLGRWSFDPDSQVLRLSDGGDALASFALLGDGSLEMLDRAGRPIDSRLNHRLARLPAFDPIEATLTMRGSYVYQADAGLFTECVSGRQMPVLSEADNRTLESGYLRLVRSPGEPLVVTLYGRVLWRMPTEGQGPVAMLVPERVVDWWPRETCGTPLAQVVLRETYWRLTRVGESWIDVQGGQREPHLVLEAGGKLRGFDGCNRFSGTVEAADGRFEIGKLASTRRHCPVEMDQANRFNARLLRASGYRIEGSHLLLLDRQGRVLARFEAVALTQ